MVRTIASGLPLLCHFHFLIPSPLLIICVAFNNLLRIKKELLRERLGTVI